MAATQERKSLLTLNSRSTRRKLQATVLVINRSVHTHLNAANNLRQLLHSVKVHQHEVVNIHTGQLANGCHSTTGATARQRLVNLNVLLSRVHGAALRISTLRHINHQVTRERQHAHVLTVLADLQQHHHVRASLRIAVILIAVRAVIALTGVGANHENVQGAVLQAVLVIADVQLLSMQIIAHTQSQHATKANNNDEHASSKQSNPLIAV